MVTRFTALILLIVCLFCWEHSQCFISIIFTFSFSVEKKDDSSKSEEALAIENEEVPPTTFIMKNKFEYFKPRVEVETEDEGNKAHIRDIFIRGTVSANRQTIATTRIVLGECLREQGLLPFPDPLFFVSEFYFIHLSFCEFF